MSTIAYSLEEEKTNYDQVAELKPGTIFQFGQGVPWLRTYKGIMDLITSEALEDHSDIRNDEIPVSWKKAASRPLNILYVPTI